MNVVLYFVKNTMLTIMQYLEQEIDRLQMTMMDLESMVDQNSYAKLLDLFVNTFPLEDGTIKEDTR